MSPYVLACLLLVCVSFDTDYIKLIRGFMLATSVLCTPSSFLPSGHAVAKHLFPGAEGAGWGLTVPAGLLEG